MGIERITADHHDYILLYIIVGFLNLLSLALSSRSGNERAVVDVR
jgi:hypothetical protein